MKKIIVLLFFSLLIILSSLNFGFFWDNVLFAYKMGNPLYIHGVFNWGCIPLADDPGHPPFLGTILAIGWFLFGQTLSVSHWMMFPFVFGVLYQIDIFIKQFITKDTYILPAFILVIADPTFLTQLILVNPEVIQLFFFFLALNGILKNKNNYKVIGLFFLGIVTLRGMMLCVGLFFIDILFNYFIHHKKLNLILNKKLITSYIIASIPAILFISWRVYVKGYISSHPNETYGNAWHYESITDFIKNFTRNIIVMLQRFLDFGRIVPILFVLITLYKKKYVLKNPKVKSLLIIACFSTSIIIIISLLINNPMGHRYFILLYLSIGLLSFLLIKEYTYKKTIYCILISSLILGNFIVYPDKISQGWDASLAHIPYWKLRKNAIDYLDKNKIQIDKTASFFPNHASLNSIDLSGDNRTFTEFTGEEEYVFYSNIYNLTDLNLSILNNDYVIAKSFESFNVRIDILKRTRKHN